MLSNKYTLLFFCCLIFLSCKKKESVTGTNTATTFLNVSYGAHPSQKMDVYLPAGRSAASTKVMVLIHGGAWASGDKADFGAFIDTIKKRWPDYALFNINYRLSGLSLNVFPTQELDTKAAIDFIYSKRNEYLTSDNFTLVGISAGAHLSLLHAYKYSTPVKAKVVVDFFGPTDMVDLYNNPGVVQPSTIAEIIGATPSSDPALYFESSPINYATNGAACPTIIFQGDMDPLVNAVRQSQLLRNKLISEGVPVQYVEYNGGHGDWSPAIYTDAFNKIESFIEVHNP